MRDEALKEHFASLSAPRGRNNKVQPARARTKTHRKGKTTMSEEEVVRHVGTVKWFNAGSRSDGGRSSGGYGFIQPDSPGPGNSGDIFVHISAVQRSGLDTLREGERISYKVVPDRRSGKPNVVDLQRLEPVI
jgi:cold shock protein